jgi:hypothetical protein
MWLRSIAFASTSRPQQRSCARREQAQRSDWRATFRCYNQCSSVPHVPEFTVFWVDDLTGRAEAITAISADAAVAQVSAEHPSARATAVEAEALEGCNRTRLLWDWMGMVTG